MALVHITLCRVADRSPFALLPIVTAVPDAAQSIASSAASQVSAIAAEKVELRVWTIAATGNVWVRFGAAPVAAADNGHLILAGQSRDFSVTVAGEKVAVKDA